MALQSQIMEIPLAGGVETKLDPRLVQPGSVLTLQNAEFSKAGALNKRNGYTALTKTTSAGTLSAAVGIYRRKDELLLADGQNFYTYTPNASRWQLQTPSPLQMMSIKTRGLAGAVTSSTAHHPDIAVSGNIALAAWGDGASLYATVMDITTGAIIVRPTLLGTLTAPNEKVSVSASGGFLYVTASMVDIPNTVKTFYVNAASPTTISAGVSLAIDYDSALTTIPMAAGTVLLAYIKQATFALTALTFNSSGVVIAETGAGITGLTGTACVAAVQSAAGKVYLCTRNAAGAIAAVGRNADLSSLFASVTVEAGITTTNICGYEDTSSNYVYFAYDSLSGGDQQIRYGAVNQAGSLTVSATGLIFNCTIAGQWITSANLHYLPVSASTARDSVPGLNLVTLAGKVVGSALRGFPLAQSTTKFTAISSGAFWGLQLYNLQSTGVGILSPPVIVTVDLTHKPVGAVLGENLYLTGGVLWEYDGVSFVEAGFLQRPVVTATTSTAGGSLTDGTYQLTAIYRWVDASGQIHESGVADIQTYTFNSGSNTNKITPAVSTLTLTNKTGVEIVIYLTLVNASTFYEKTSSTITAGSGAVVAFSAITTAAVATSPELYTTGGVVENGPPDSLQSIVRKGERLYGVDYQGRLWFTKSLTKGLPALFADELFTQRLVDDPMGNALSVDTMDGDLYFYGPSTLQRVSGDGPTDTGLQNDLSPPQLLSTTVGVNGQVRGAVTDLGYLFKSTSGFVLLDRSGQVNQPFGFPADSFKSLTTVSAVTLPGKKQVRFGHSDGSVVMFDYASQKWAELTNHTQVAALVSSDLYTWVTSAGQVEQQSAGYAEGDASSITMLVETPWLNLGALQGFVRLYQASVLGVWKSAHTLNVLVYKNHSETPVATKSIDLSTGYSADQVFDVGVTIGHKCKAVKFKVYDSAQSGTKESFSLVSLGLNLGGKSGLFRLPVTKQM